MTNKELYDKILEYISNQMDDPSSKDDWYVTPKEASEKILGDFYFWVTQKRKLNKSGGIGI